MSPTVYLVDDHPLLREGVRAMLEADGYEVVGESADLTQALADLSAARPDILMLDLTVGDRSGLELLGEIKRRDLQVKTLVLSMSSHPRHVAEALRLGALGYVLKGADRAELGRAIRSVGAGKRYLGPDVADIALKAFVNPVPDDPLATLSPRERQIIVMVVKGQSSAEIGSTLHLSPRTVDTYRSRLMAKLGVADLTGLVRFAIRVGLIDADMA